MNKEEQLFNEIVEKICKNNKDVELGKMMSSPGLKYNNKVFAFYYDNEMTFKLGKDFDPGNYGINKFSFLSPFKNKPPMKAWFQLPFEEKDNWLEMAKLALSKMKNEK